MFVEPLTRQGITAAAAQFHQPVLERPEATLAAIVEFAQSLPPGASAGRVTTPT